jgi:hypothetical protein
MRDDTISVRAEFADILPWIMQRGSFTREQALEAEIERLTEALRPYLKAFRESLVAEGLMDAVSNPEVSSAVGGMVHQLQDRVTETNKRLADLAAEHDDEIQQLRMVLRMRDELAPGA